MKIIFMGTPDFAVPSLKKLVDNGYDVVAVITAPDRPAGRGQQLRYSAVKEYAMSQRIPVLQPTNLKSEAFLDELRAYKADLQVVVAFRMLPEVVWAMPPKGTFNLHASLLPKYRGAAPINWAIINGEKVTGATTFFIKKEIDTGSILLQDEVIISEDMTAGELHDELMVKGSELVLETVKAIDADDYQLRAQDLDRDYPPAPKIFKEDCRIDWQQDIESIYNFIRGLSPYPGAWTKLDGKLFKVYKAKKEITGHLHETGQLISDGKDYLKVALPDGYIDLIEIQIEGKKKLSVEEFLRGFTVEGKKVV